MKFNLKFIPYTIRNTLVLGIILIIVSSIVGFLVIKKVKIYRELSAEKSKLELRLTEIDQILPDNEGEKRITEALRLLDEKQRSQEKIVTKEDFPTDTYEYLIGLSNRGPGRQKFDFEIENTGTQVGEFSSNHYLIKGAGHIRKLVDFINEIERQTRLYTLENLNIFSQSVIRRDTVFFTFDLKSYFSSNGLDLEKIPYKNLDKENIKYNPFFPRIHPIYMKKSDKYLINIDAAKMISLTKDMVILQYNGQMKVLKHGDRVMFGKLYRIDWKKQIAIFKINKIGITETKILYLK